MRCLGKALLKNGLRGLARLVPLGEVLVDVAIDAYAEYRKGHSEAELPSELEGLSRAPAAELEAARQPAEEVNRSLVPGTREYQAAFGAAVTTRTDWTPEVVAGHAVRAGYTWGQRPPVGVERLSRAARERGKAVRAESRAAKARQADLLRDLFGPALFHTPAVAPAVLAWSGGLVQRLAEVAYEERSLPSGHLDGHRLAVLADALIDAGCDDAGLLEHLRGPGPHTRGCWPLDLLLAKR